MAYFTAKELKSKMSGGARNSRELKHEGTIKLWIPNEQFFYARKHFNLHMVPMVKSSAKSCWCMNTSPELTERCPICDYIQTLWKEWREASKESKEKIQGVINKLVDEKYWVNAIDLSDKEQKFIAVKFTASRMKEILTIIEKDPVDGIIWSYKKTSGKDKSGKERISYSLTESTDDARAHELKENYDFLWGRNFEQGGPIDLEKVYGKTQTYDQLHDYLTKSNGEDESDAELDDSEVSTLDDVAKPVTKTATAKTTTQTPAKTTVKPKEDDLSLDNLSLDSDNDLSLDTESLSLDGDDELSLDDISAPIVKKVKMPKDFIVKNLKNKQLLSQVIEHFKEEKILEITGDMKKDVNAINNYLKTNDLEVPESLLEESISI
jgi:hypothetical protein